MDFSRELGLHIMSPKCNTYRVWSFVSQLWIDLFYSPFVCFLSYPCYSRESSSILKFRSINNLSILLIQGPIFGPTQCHSDGSSRGGQALMNGSRYPGNSLINVPSRLRTKSCFIITTVLYHFDFINSLLCWFSRNC